MDRRVDNSPPGGGHVDRDCTLLAQHDACHCAVQLHCLYLTCRSQAILGARCTHLLGYMYLMLCCLLLLSCLLLLCRLLLTAQGLMRCCHPWLNARTTGAGGGAEVVVVVAEAGGSSSQAAGVERAEVHQQVPESCLVGGFIVVVRVCCQDLGTTWLFGLLQACLLRHSVRLQGH